MFNDIITRFDQDIAQRLVDLGYSKVYILSTRKFKPVKEAKESNNLKLQVNSIPFINKKERELNYKGLVAAPAKEEFFNIKKPMLIILDWNISVYDGLHQRRSALNHITASLASKNNKVLVFSVKKILEANDKSIALGRAMQDAKLTKKYDCPFVIATLADNAKQLHSPQTLRSLALMLGFDEQTIKKSKTYWDIIDSYL